LRIYLLEQGCQSVDVDPATAAAQFLTWLATDANPLLNDLVQTWLWQPAQTGGLGALAESAWDIALLRAEITAAWPVQLPRRRPRMEAGR
jgi:hypothetical protein